MWNFKKDIYRTRRENECLDCISHNVVIGTQTWTGCNADTEYYNNGDPIPYVDDASTWASLTTGAWCYYNNDPLNGAKYGKLYNWYAISDPRGIAPVGYHIPSEAEFTTLTNYLGSSAVAGGKLKESGFCHWVTPNTGATDLSGFTGLPGGARTNTGGYTVIGTYGDWWTSTSFNLTNSRHFYLTNFSAASSIANYFNVGGLSVRFIKDCPDVIIDTQTWTACNLNVETYSNGEVIPEITDAVTWAAATTGAWCYYNFDSANGPIYGKLYNWYAVNDPRGLAPSGYHVPTNTEWTTLTTFLGGTAFAGGELKEVGTAHWTAPNTGATNSTGFTALGGGFCDDTGTFLNINITGSWWSSTENTPTASWFRNIFNSSASVGVFNAAKTYGYSVRLIKD